MKKYVVVLFLVLVAAFMCRPVFAEDKAEHAVTGTVTKIDDASKTFVIKTADGTEETFKWTGKSMIKAGKEGTNFVVHYTEEGSDKTAVAVKDIGKGTLKVADGTVTKVGDGGKTITVKTADGTEHTFDVAAHATADAGTETGKSVATACKVGDHVTVHYTEDAGKKVAHFIKHL
jgi:preprotein translocase subunit YajC